MAREYRNINTIMEKMRTGSLNAASSQFSFQNVTYYKKKEVVKPYLHWLDDKSLKKAIKSFFSNQSELRNRVHKICVAKNMASKAGQLADIMWDAFNKGKLPPSLSNDLFNMYYNDMQDLDFEKQRISNSTVFKILEKLNQPSMKILSHQNPLKTMILVRTLLMNFLFAYALKKLANDPDADKLMDQLGKCNNTGQGEPKPGQQGQGKPGQGSGSGQGKPELNQGGGQNASHKNGPDEVADRSGNANPMANPAPKPQPSPAQDKDEDEEGQPGDPDEDEEDQEDQNEDQDQDDADAEDDQNPADQGKPQTNQNQPRTNTPDADDDDDDTVDPYDDEDDDVDEGPTREKDEDDVDTFHAGGEENSGGSSGSGNEGSWFQSVEQQLSNLLNRTMGDEAAMKFSEQAISEARDMMANIDHTMSEDEQKKSWEDLSDGFKVKTDILDQLNPEFIEGIAKQMDKIKMNMSGIKSVLKHLLDKTVNYFSSKEESYFENIFDADSLAGLEEIEMLHPKLRKLNLDDIMLREARKVGMIDMYVDISGSMTAWSGMVDDDNKNISCEQFAKAMVLKMKQIDLLDQLYTFDTSVIPRGNTSMHVLTMGGGGGTDIRNVIKKVRQTGKNSLVITDGQDYCDVYDDRVYFLAVSSANFRSFREDVRKEYVDNDQMIIFDGETALKVGYDGLPICPPGYVKRVNTQRTYW